MTKLITIYNFPISGSHIYRKRESTITSAPIRSTSGTNNFLICPKIFGKNKGSLSWYPVSTHSPLNFISTPSTCTKKAEKQIKMTLLKFEKKTRIRTHLKGLPIKIKQFYRNKITYCHCAYNYTSLIRTRIRVRPSRNTSTHLTFHITFFSLSSLKLAPNTQKPTEDQRHILKRGVLQLRKLVTHKIRLTENREKCSKYDSNFIVQGQTRNNYYSKM